MLGDYKWRELKDHSLDFALLNSLKRKWNGMAIIDERNRYVALDLNNGEVTEAIIEAIELDNENVVITRLPEKIKVEVLNKLVINRETVEDCLDGNWQTKDLQIVVRSYYGFLGDWDEDHIILQWDSV
jgi:phenol/toluene 2-monooxygenase (NADH) P2/A2